MGVGYAHVHTYFGYMHGGNQVSSLDRAFLRDKEDPPLRLLVRIAGIGPNRLLMKLRRKTLGHFNLTLIKPSPGPVTFVKKLEFQ